MDWGNAIVKVGASHGHSADWLKDWVPNGNKGVASCCWLVSFYVFPLCGVRFFICAVQLSSSTSPAVSSTARTLVCPA